MHDIILLFYSIWIFSIDEEIYVANFGLVIALIVIMIFLISFLVMLLIINAIIEAVRKIREATNPDPNKN